MIDDRDFQKRLAKLQIQATMLAILVSAILALGIVLLSYSMTLEIQEGSELFRNYGTLIIGIAIGIALYLLKSYYRDVDRVDKGRRFYR